MVSARRPGHRPMNRGRGISADKSDASRAYSHSQEVGRQCTGSPRARTAGRPGRRYHRADWRARRTRSRGRSPAEQEERKRFATCCRTGDGRAASRSSPARVPSTTRAPNRAPDSDAAARGRQNGGLAAQGSIPLDMVKSVISGGRSTSPSWAAWRQSQRRGGMAEIHAPAPACRPRPAARRSLVGVCAEGGGGREIVRSGDLVAEDRARPAPVAAAASAADAGAHPCHPLVSPDGDGGRARRLKAVTAHALCLVWE